MDVALVIAGASFVGRHLLAQLSRRNVPVRATSRQRLPGFLSCDLHRPTDIDTLLQSIRPRWLFACAGATAASDLAELRALHVAATESLLTAAARHVPDAVTVLFGSAAEYGPVTPDQLPIREDTLAQPNSPYGQSKLEQLRIARCLAERHGLRIHVARPFNLIGPGLGRQYFAAKLCERLRQARPGDTIAVENGAATRDWVDGRDAADAVVRLALDAPPAAGTVEIYNIATGQETPVLALAQHLCRLAGDLHAIDAGSTSSRSGIARSCGDATRLRRATGWQPTVPWQRSAEELWLV